MSTSNKKEKKLQHKIAKPSITFFVDYSDEDDADRKEPVYGGRTAVKNSDKDKLTISEPQTKRLYAIASKNGYEPSKLQEMVKQKYHCFVKNLTIEQYDYIISKLEEK